MTDFTPTEMMTIAAARALSNDDVCFVGIGAPSAACNVARLTHAPDITLIYESGTIGTAPDVLPLSIGDGELCETALCTVSVPEMFRYWLMGGRISVGFLGAAQLDRFGNINTTIIGDYAYPKVRLPGGGGAPEIATSCQEIFITLKQARRSMVEKIDFFTSFGHGDGGDHRQRLGITTRGPTCLITDLAIWQPDVETKEFTVTALHRGVTRDMVQETCGWTVRFADDLGETPEPTELELGTLRALQARTAAAHAEPIMAEAFICAFRRTPIGRFGGALSSVRPDDLGAVPLKALMTEHASLDWEAVDDVIFGCANQAGEDNRNVARMSLLLAGLPVGVSGTTINRLCGSGMDAVIAAARAIRSGDGELYVAGGVESMSRAPFVMPKAETAFSRNAEIYDTTIGWRFVNPAMQEQYGVDSMPETGENVAADYAISRADQDGYALRSQQRAVAAQANGRLAREIVPVTVPRRKGDPLVVDRDEHPRGDTTFEALARLPTPFRQGGTVTAGNASGVNDGAAALIVASEAAAQRHGLTPIARVLGGAAAGVPPRIMGMGPVPATRKLCERLGLTPADFDVVELNEAFASQALAVLRELGLDDDANHINANGGAIALGHPLGMSGARIAGTAALELMLSDKRRALATMCVGVGQGIAIALERAG